MDLKIALIMITVCNITLLSSMAKAEIDPARFNELGSERTVLLARIKGLDLIKSHIATLQAERNAAEDSVYLAQIKSQDARSNLQRKQNYDRENPNEITNKLREAELQNIQATNALNLTKENLDRVGSKIISLNTQASVQYQQMKQLQQDFENHLNVIVANQEKLAVAKLQVVKIVEAKGVMSCGDDGIRICKEKSKKEAEKNAADQGSIIDFSAFTEVKNFQLSKEVIRSEVHANLFDEQILSQKLVDESSAITVIRVKVEPVISLNLRQKIASGIRNDLLLKLGGRIDFYEVADPSVEATVTAPQRQIVEQTRQDTADVEPDFAQHSEDADHRSAIVKTGSQKEVFNNWSWKLSAGANSNNYSAKFDKAFNNGVANSKYSETVIGLSLNRKDGLYLDILGAQGKGKHDLYTPFSDQDFKRSTALLIVGKKADSTRLKPDRVYMITSIAKAKMTAIGQVWTESALTTAGLGAGLGYDLPISSGTFAIDTDLSFSSAKLTDDIGNRASANSLNKVGIKIGYTYWFAQRFAVTANYQFSYGGYKFKTFEVVEENQTIGVNIFAKF
jgi:hypothetical protein